MTVLYLALCFCIGALIGYVAFDAFDFIYCKWREHHD